MCSGCGREFQTRSHLEYHIRSKSSIPQHFPKTAKCFGKVSGARVIFPCKLCGKFFTRKDNLRNHLRNYTTDNCMLSKDSIKQGKAISNYDCPICGKSFGGAMLRSLHALTHKGDASKSASVSKVHRCNKCGKVFTFLSTLKQHETSCEIRTERGNEQNVSVHKCTECSSTFKSKLQLIGHSRMHTTLQKPHKCPQCEKRYLNPSQLRLHLLSHKMGKHLLTNNSGCFCSKCDISFGNTHNLERHLWYAHSEVIASKKNKNSKFNYSRKTSKKLPLKTSLNHSIENVICKIEVKVEPLDVNEVSDVVHNQTIKNHEPAKYTSYKTGKVIMIKQEPLEECDSNNHS